MSTGTALAATSRREDPGVLIRRAKKLYDAARTTDGDSSKKLSAALHLFKVVSSFVSSIPRVLISPLSACLLPRPGHDGFALPRNPHRPFGVLAGCVLRNKPLMGYNKQASILCPCNNVLYTSSKQIGLSTKDIPLPNCHCKVYLDLAATNVNDGDREKLAIYELATKPCACGSGIATCRSAVHIEALDGTIAVAEAQKDYIKAIQYTSLLITMAPHAPEGYLRLVKILRLQSLSSRPTVKVDNQCAYILSQGCWTVRSFGDKEHEKVKVRASPAAAPPLHSPKLNLSPDHRAPDPQRHRALPAPGVAGHGSEASVDDRPQQSHESIQGLVPRIPRPLPLERPQV